MNLPPFVNVPLNVPLDVQPLYIRLVRDAASVRCYRDGDVVVLEYPPTATGAELQAALDAQGCPVGVTVEPLGDPVVETKRRRPGPPPRHESARERARRQRRESR